VIADAPSARCQTSGTEVCHVSRLELTTFHESKDDKITRGIGYSCRKFTATSQLAWRSMFLIGMG
jgi:hypothetical protein